MFFLSVESGLYGEIKSIKCSCPLVLPLSTRAVETLQGFYVIFKI